MFNARPNFLRVATGAVVLAFSALATVGPANARGFDSTPPPESSAPAPPPAAPGAAPSSRPVTFGIGTATAGRLDRRDGVQLLIPRGGTATDTVAVVNLAYVPLTLDVFPVDVVNDVNGRLRPQPTVEKLVGAGAWVTMKTPTNKRTVTVAPKGTLIVPITVRVPKNASVGDHLVGLMVSLTAQGQSDGQKSTDVNLEQRVGIRLNVRVAGALRPELTIENLAASYTGTLNPVGRGKAQVTWVVRNTGNVKLGGRQSLNIQSLFGAAAADVGVPDVPVLLPGGAANVSVVVPDVMPAGVLTANVNVVPQSAVGDANPVLGITSASVRFVAIPWTLLALILLLGLLAAWFVRRRRQAALAQEAGSTDRSPSSTTLTSSGR